MISVGIPKNFQNIKAQYTEHMVLKSTQQIMRNSRRWPFELALPFNFLLKKYSMETGYLAHQVHADYQFPHSH